MFSSSHLFYILFVSSRVSCLNHSNILEAPPPTTSKHFIFYLSPLSASEAVKCRILAGYIATHNNKRILLVKKEGKRTLFRKLLVHPSIYNKINCVTLQFFKIINAGIWPQTFSNRFRIDYYSVTSLQLSGFHICYLK